MKKIIEVLILIGGLMMIIACANPSSVVDDANTTPTSTIDNGGSETNNGNPTNEEPISNIINAEFKGNKTFEIVINDIYISENNNEIKIKNSNDTVHIKSIPKEDGTSTHSDAWKTSNFNSGLKTSISGNKVTIKYTNKTDTYCSTANCYYNISEKTLYISY